MNQTLGTSMKMTMSEIQHLDHPVDKLMLVSLCSMSYQLYAEDKGERFAIYTNKGEKVVSKSLEEGRKLIHSLNCKSAVLYQQLPYDEACAPVAGEMSPAMEIPLSTH
jgi:hypothetical protein